MLKNFGTSLHRGWQQAVTDSVEKAAETKGSNKGNMYMGGRYFSRLRVDVRRGPFVNEETKGLNYAAGLDFRLRRVFARTAAARKRIHKEPSAFFLAGFSSTRLGTNGCESNYTIPAILFTTLRHLLLLFPLSFFADFSSNRYLTVRFIPI